MWTHLKLIARSFVSKDAHAELYQKSRVPGAEIGVRNRLTFNVCLLMALALAFFLGSLSLKSQSPEDFVQKAEDIAPLAGTALSVRYGLPQILTCKTRDGCFEELASANTLAFVATPKHKAEFSGVYTPIVGSAERQMLLRFRLKLTGTRIPADSDDLVVSLPRMNYQRAHLYIGGVHQASFLNGDRVSLPLKATAYRGQTLTLFALLELGKGDDQEFLRWDEPVFVASHPAFAKYQRFMEDRRANPSGQVSSLARVILAIFALILFMIVESSPEALGLALFMGFEACALVMAQQDLRRAWLPDDVNLDFIIHYCNAMGDVYRLNFFLALCRVIEARPRRWFFYSSLYAVPYGLLRYFHPDFGFPNWATHHVIQRDMLVATVGMILCARSAFYLRNAGLPWRVAALALATFAATAQWLEAAPYYLPFLDQLGELVGGYGGFITVVNVNSAYLFTLSTFINISTLENRVKTLSREKARAEAIERELELGRRVQEAFQKQPQLPPELTMSSHYEAAQFVSGDSYFVHWSETGRVLTFLLNDVTGHGIQAALKAFASNIIARSIWNRPQRRGERRGGEQRLKLYDETVVELICNDAENPDFNAMVGAELSVDERLLRLYRVNYNFPIVIEPRSQFGGEAPADGVYWQIRQIPIPNQQVVEVPLVEGAIIMLISDGFIENARDNREILRHLKRELQSKPHSVLDVAAVRSAAAIWKHETQATLADDRTLLVFQWNPNASSKVAPIEPAAAAAS